ncbi:MAG: ATP-binding protein [Bacilli bacterium]|nr:ATP-binding protein [Bacilli bacterium]
MVNREIYLDELKRFKDKDLIKVITGIRRCGKSTLFDLYVDYLKTEGIKDNQIIQINLEEPKYHFENYMELYNYINEKLNKNKKNYVFLDEVQNIPEFQKAVDGLYINKNVDLYITGSNAYLLSGELATLLSGRYIEIEMLPLSFKEFLSSKEDKNELKQYESYIEEGGFPYIINLNDIDEISKYLDGVYNTVLMKDVISKNKIGDTMILDSVVKFIFDNIGQLVSTKKISDTLKSNGRGNSVNTIENYLTNLIDSYIIYKVSRYDIKGKEFLKTGDKYYVCDLGLRNYLLGNITNRGSILENIIFLELKRRGYKIYIGKNDDKEIDFVVKNHTGIKYIQVSESVRNEDTLKRELSALQEIKDNYPKYIITLDYDKCDYNGIKQISALDFLLGKEEL